MGTAQYLFTVGVYPYSDAKITRFSGRVHSTAFVILWGAFILALGLKGNGVHGPPGRPSCYRFGNSVSDHVLVSNCDLKDNYSKNMFARCLFLHRSRIYNLEVVQPSPGFVEPNI